MQYSSITNLIKSCQSTYNLYTSDWKKHDYIVYFLIVPIIITSIFFIPLIVKQKYFILSPSNVTIFTLFLSNYVHSNWQHFIGNLISYLILCWIIFNFEVDKNLFYAYSILMFFLLPWIISIISIELMFQLQMSMQGFSGIVSSLLGYMTYAIYKYIKKFYLKNLNTYFLFTILFINLLLILPNIHANTYLYIILFTIIIAFLYAQKNIIKEGYTLIKRTKTKLKGPLSLLSYYSLVLFISSLIYLFSLPLLIPEVHVVDGHIINSLAHYIGYVFGVFTPLVLKKYSTNG